MKRKYREKPKLLKWHTYPAAKRESIIDEFWLEYFAKYPNDGVLDELNVMRRQYAEKKY